MATKRCIVLGFVALAAASLSIPDVAQAQDTTKKPALVGTWRVVFERPPAPARTGAGHVHLRRDIGSPHHRPEPCDERVARRVETGW